MIKRIPSSPWHAFRSGPRHHRGVSGKSITWRRRRSSRIGKERESKYQLHRKCCLMVDLAGYREATARRELATAGHSKGAFCGKRWVQVGAHPVLIDSVLAVVGVALWPTVCIFTKSHLPEVSTPQHGGQMGGSRCYPGTSAYLFIVTPFTHCCDHCG